MKKLILSFGLFAIVATVGLQPVLAADQGSFSASRFKKEDRDVQDFNAVMAGGPISVVITMGNTESLRFEGDADAISTLVTEVVKNKLIIRPKTSWTSWAHKYEGKKIIAYVNAKNLKSLAMSGDGSIVVKGHIQASDFASVVSGSGSITASVDASSFSGVITGSGSLNISGKSDNASITISGSGSFAKKGFSASDLSAVISGSGSINIEVDDSINAVISGSGSIYYAGNASVEKRIIGSGRVKKV